MRASVFVNSLVVRTQIPQLVTSEDLGNWFPKPSEILVIDFCNLLLILYVISLWKGTCDISKHNHSSQDRPWLWGKAILLILSDRAWQQTQLLSLTCFTNACRLIDPHGWVKNCALWLHFLTLLPGTRSGIHCYYDYLGHKNQAEPVMRSYIVPVGFQREDSVFATCLSLSVVLVGHTWNPLESLSNVMQPSGKSGNSSIPETHCSK